MVQEIFLVNTHTDKDHTGCNKDFKPVYMHPAEMEHYKNALPKDFQMSMDLDFFFF